MEQDTEHIKEQLKQQEKLASLGMLSAGIAHEVQNPLNFVVNFGKISAKLIRDLTEILEDNADRLPAGDREDAEDIISDLQANMSKIMEHGERATAIIRSILLISRGKEGEFTPSDICAIVREYVWLSYHAMRANITNFRLNIHEDYQPAMPLANVIPQDLSRAVVNIMNNACYAVWRKAQKAADYYSPAISVTVKADRGDAVIIIADNGEGMTPEVQQRLYENFFTTKPIGHGTGLGMSIVKDIVEERHHGTISFTSTPGEGTSFTLRIPMRQ